MLWPWLIFLSLLSIQYQILYQYPWQQLMLPWDLNPRSIMSVCAHLQKEKSSFNPLQPRIISLSSETSVITFHKSWTPLLYSLFSQPHSKAGIKALMWALQTHTELHRNEVLEISQIKWALWSCESSVVSGNKSGWWKRATRWSRTHADRKSPKSSGLIYNPAALAILH